MKRMLFNATQQEELRVAIVDGQKLIDIDIETTGREQQKGNIYKGVITRIESSLDACFVNYGEERHGFLPFKEIIRPHNDDETRGSRPQQTLRAGQELIVQIEKEGRGNKGAALTTFISLAGRYLVLMPNNPNSGGVSRRIEGEERQELREIMSQLSLPDEMSLIARTAGIGRSLEELQWDLNYLTQLWQAVTHAAANTSAPLLIYLESSLVIRAIRDYFHPDIGEILIDTEEVYEQARAFMSVVMPDNLQKIKRYRDDVPLFSRFQIEHQIETAYSRMVPLPSGGAVVIDHTEALVAIDVNSARATKGSDIAETALRTNLEAADEITRQLRLRDLGGLIVIDFIDMEAAKNQRDVEQCFRETLKHDRARVQIGKISRFGLMELSRQRLRPALSEGSHVTCPRCNGTGHIRDIESSALQVLRILQEEAMKEQTAAIYCQAPVEVMAFLLNEKRQEINKIEIRFKVNVTLIPNKSLDTPHYKLERLRHDDPRLEHPSVSYKMAEEAARELDTEISQGKRAEPRLKQEAAVKGMTPDQPAPSPSRDDTKMRAALSQGQGIGLMGWVKRLFGFIETFGFRETDNDSHDAEATTIKQSARTPHNRGNQPARSARRHSRDTRPQQSEQTTATGASTGGTSKNANAKTGAFVQRAGSDAEQAIAVDKGARTHARNKRDEHENRPHHSATTNMQAPSGLVQPAAETNQTDQKNQTNHIEIGEVDTGGTIRSNHSTADEANPQPTAEQPRRRRGRRGGRRERNAEGNSHLSEALSEKTQGVIPLLEKPESDKLEEKAPAPSSNPNGQRHKAETPPVKPLKHPLDIKHQQEMASASLEALKPLLNAAGLVWVDTKADKVQSAPECNETKTIRQPQVVLRERKPLPPVSAAPINQVETLKTSSETQL